MAALWSEWIDPEHGGTIHSFSIVTTVGNGMMAKIHNNPKLKEPRMPLILSDDMEEQWLSSHSDFEKELKELLNRNDKVELEAHTVGKLRGKNYAGNTASIANEVKYMELETNGLDF